MVDDELGQLRNAYGAALGPGFPSEALVLLDEGGAERGEWCIKVDGKRARCLDTSELDSRDLFVLPPGW